MITVVFDVADPDKVAGFWAEMLGRSVVEEPLGPLLAGDERAPALRFCGETRPKVDPDRVHLHLTSDDLNDQQAIVARAVRLGATHLDVGQRPEEGHIVLSDPGGNAFCVLGPGNAFLAGCGFFGEVACEGTRELGVFWSQVLDWPMVWDENGETAIQSPAGGTKVAWGGPPLAVKTVRGRQRFELSATQAQFDRLVALGASHRHTDPDGVIELADPDGNEFTLVPATCA